MNLLGKIDITRESIEMEIKDLEGNALIEDEAQKPKISLYGVDSEAFRNAAKDSNEDDSDRGEKLIASCVESWANVKTDEGLPIECNFENAVKLFKRYPIVFSQCDVFVSKRANYLKKY